MDLTFQRIDGQIEVKWTCMLDRVRKVCFDAKNMEEHVALGLGEGIYILLQSCI